MALVTTHTLVCDVCGARLSSYPSAAHVRYDAEKAGWLIALPSDVCASCVRISKRVAELTDGGEE